MEPRAVTLERAGLPAKKDSVSLRRSNLQRSSFASSVTLRVLGSSYPPRLRVDRGGKHAEGQQSSVAP